MSEEDNMQASNEAAADDTTAGESQAQEQTTEVNADQSVQTTEQPKESAPASEGDKSASTQNQEAKVDSKPVSRRSAAYRIQQLVEENKALKAQAQKPAQTDQYDWEAPPQEEESQLNIDARIQQAVQKALHPVISESSKAADDGEISELFTGEKAAERSKYEPRIREMWNQAQYKDVAAQDLYKIAKFDELSASMDTIKQQAVEEYKAALKEAKDSSASGTSNTSNRMGETSKSINDMTDEEFRQHNERVKAGLA